MYEHKPLVQPYPQSDAKRYNGMADHYNGMNCAEHYQGGIHTAFTGADPEPTYSDVYFRERYSDCPATPEPPGPPALCPPVQPSPESLVRYEYIPSFLRVYIGDTVRVDILKPQENLPY